MQNKKRLQSESLLQEDDQMAGVSFNPSRSIWIKESKMKIVNSHHAVNDEMM